MLSGRTEVKRYTPRELRVKMAEHDMTAREFAEMVGISQTYMSQLLTGRQPHASHIVRIRIAEVVEQLDAKLAEEEAAMPKAPDGVTPRVRRL